MKKNRLVMIKKNKKVDTGDPAAYGLICLLSTVGKTFERLLNSRIMDKVKVSRHQYGFKKGTAVADAIRRIMRTIQ